MSEQKTISEIENFQIEKKKIKSMQHSSSGSKFDLFIFLKSSYF